MNAREEGPTVIPVLHAEEHRGGRLPGRTAGKRRGWGANAGCPAPSLRPLAPRPWQTGIRRCQEALSLCPGTRGPLASLSQQPSLLLQMPPVLQLHVFLDILCANTVTSRVSSLCLLFRNTYGSFLYTVFCTSFSPVKVMS